MPWQLSCHGMCIIVTWCDHHFSSNKNTQMFAKFGLWLLVKLCLQTRLILCQMSLTVGFLSNLTPGNVGCCHGLQYISPPVNTLKLEFVYRCYSMFQNTSITWCCTRMMNDKSRTNIKLLTHNRHPILNFHLHGRAIWGFCCDHFGENYASVKIDLHNGSLT